LDNAKDAYYAAYTNSIKNDLKRKYLPITGLNSLIGFEAGKGYVRLTEAEKPATRDESRRTAKVKKDVEKLANLPRGAITPIVFSFEEHCSLSDLLMSGLRVPFDLDGDGLIERWPWVKATTGILVWDPDAKGTITSGRQMFGSVSWWLFFMDGYQALDALDDNRDGVLSGPELTGISVWFDRDSDGKSDLGEVIPVEKLSIVSITTNASGKNGGCPMNKRGLILVDGRTVATYDWIASSIQR
jgi:hypothetical protein